MHARLVTHQFDSSRSQPQRCHATITDKSFTQFILRQSSAFKLIRPLCSVRKTRDNFIHFNIYEKDLTQPAGQPTAGRPLKSQHTEQSKERCP